MARCTLSFFNRPTLEVAEDLLGKVLVRRHNDILSRHLITEVEAYDGPEDKACHASGGKTKRNAILFEKAGYWYVYLCYGMHWMLNIVTGEKGYPAAILFRGLTDVQGPGRLTKHLQIDRKFNGRRCLPSDGLWIESNPSFSIEHYTVKRSPRIGVAYAGPIWANKPYRFFLT